MGKLMKYEFRKTMFSKVILLVITAIAEILFLAGIFAEWENGIAIGMIGLVLCASVGTLYIGLESLTIFQKDLNTKQSYMLFLTPKNSFQILGAKVLENGLSLLLVTAFYVALAAIDVSTAVLYVGGLQEFLELLHELSISISMNIDLTWPNVIVGVAMALTVWLLVIQTGYLAIVLSSTVLAGKRFSGAVSFVLFLVISWLVNLPTELVPEMSSRNVENSIIIVITLAMVALMYALTAWVMEKKLSV